MMKAGFENSSCGPLRLIRGAEIVSDSSSTAWIEGDCLPRFREFVTKNSLCWSSKLHVAVDCLEGNAALTFGLITPTVRNEAQQRLTGKLCAWNSKSREIFFKNFDSVTNYSGCRPITHFYNIDLKSGCILCVEFLVDRKSNASRAHFTINGEDEWVSFDNGAPEFWYGYLRLRLDGNDSKIGVTVLSKENEVLCTNSPRLREKQISRSPETLQLEKYMMCSSNPRGICLLINNVPNLGMVEDKFKGLFEYLSFRVEVMRNLGSIKMLRKAREFAKKNHSKFDIFAVVIVTISGQGNEIYCADGRNACLEHVMAEYTATRCPSLQDKPKLFFIHRFSGISSIANGLCSSQTHGSCVENDIKDLPHFSGSVIARDSCPEEADFLLYCVKYNRVPDPFFIQNLDDLVKRYRHQHHLLEILTLVNKQMADRRKDRCCFQTPYRTHTLRATVHLSLVPTSASIISAVTQKERYKMNKFPRGWCIIVNNVHFKNQKLNRRGAEEDEQNLKDLFEALSFKVVIRRDLSSHELENVAQEFGAENHSEYNAFVFIVMSHGGDHDSILGVDERETTVKNLMVEYLEDKCPSLKDKPKVFIIQACRGCRNDFGKFSLSSSADEFSSEVVAMSSQAQTGSQPCDTAFSPDSTLPRSMFPPEANFVLAFSTAPGYVSHRNRKHGAWFIQALVKVIREYHQRNHFLDMLTEVTRRVVKRRNSVQVPAPMDTLTKLLYL